MKNILTLSLLCLLTFSCGQKKKEVQFFERPVKTAVVESLSHISKTFSGTVTSNEESNIGFRMGGEIIALLVEDGQKIRKGELIAEVDSHDFKMQFDAAETAYHNAQSQLSRYEKLYKKQAISQQDYEMANTSFASSKSQYENARKALHDTKLYAPFNGIIEKRFARQYQRVQPSEPVVRIINPKLLQVEFTLPIKDIPILDLKNKSFKIVFDNYPEISFNASVLKVINSTPDGSGIPVTLKIDDKNFDYNKFDIKSGFSCDVMVEASIPDMSSVVAIPVSAVYNNDTNGKKYVWIYSAQSQSVSAKEITLGDLYGSEYIIVNSGVSVGDLIVTAGVQSLTEGQKVKYLK